MVSNKTILILLIVNIILVVLIIIGIIWVIGSNKIGGLLPIAPLPKGISYTTIEIMEKAKDINSCNTLEGDYKEMCKMANINYRASSQGNPAICEEYPVKELVEPCKKKIIITLVATKYYEQNKTPDNINLCEQLTGADKEFCLNPAQVVASCYVEKLCYKSGINQTSGAST